MINRRRRLGTTLIEALMAAVLTAIVLAGALGLTVTGNLAWYRGEGNIQAESTSQDSIRVMAQDLRQAMYVAVDPNGLGLTYYLPAKDDTGTNIVPEVSDGVTYRVELDGSTLNMIAGGVTSKVCDNVILTDPNSPGGASPYVIFTPGQGTTTRSLTVMVVTQRQGYGAEQVTARCRETIYLRNVPQLSN